MCLNCISSAELPVAYSAFNSSGVVFFQYKDDFLLLSIKELLVE